MDALVPARTSGTPAATVIRFGGPGKVPAATRIGARRNVLPLAPRHPASAKHRPSAAPLQKPNWSCSARPLVRRKPSRREDEHPP
jgi:hypothetical protein